MRAGVAISQSKLSAAPCRFKRLAHARYGGRRSWDRLRACFKMWLGRARAQRWVALRSADPEAPVFRSRQGGALDASQVHRIVKAAAQRAGLSDAVSAHWLRHAHVSHALDRGAPATWCKPPSATPASPPPAATPTPARPNDSSSRYLPG